jgi:dynactin complex subunit
MTLKTTASRIGNGILDGLSAIHDISVQNQIDELDTQLEALTKQMTDLQSKKTGLQDQLSGK